MRIVEYIPRLKQLDHQIATTGLSTVGFPDDYAIVDLVTPSRSAWKRAVRFTDLSQETINRARILAIEASYFAQPRDPLPTSQLWLPLLGDAFRAVSTIRRIHAGTTAVRLAIFSTRAYAEGRELSSTDVVQYRSFCSPMLTHTAPTLPYKTPDMFKLHASIGPDIEGFAYKYNKPKIWAYAQNANKLPFLYVFDFIDYLPNSPDDYIILDPYLLIDEVRLHFQPIIDARLPYNPNATRNNRVLPNPHPRYSQYGLDLATNPDFIYERERALDSTTPPPRRGIYSGKNFTNSYTTNKKIRALDRSFPVTTDGYGHVRVIDTGRFDHQVAPIIAARSNASPAVQEQARTAFLYARAMLATHPRHLLDGSDRSPVARIQALTDDALAFARLPAPDERPLFTAPLLNPLDGSDPLDAYGRRF